MPWNGFNVVSTFSGGGGSCLGYEMAGYHVVWANEFIPEAQKTYRLNHPRTFLNTKNIRDVTADEILEECGLNRGDIDLFDGSPPCAAFSSAGSREKHWGEVKDYSSTRERVDDLFFEYTRLLRELQPKTFVAENVSGLVKGVAKGYFKNILAEMKDCGYTVSVRLLNAAYLGVPQVRQRLIFVGVRNDLCEKYGVRPVHPKPEKHVVTLGEALRGVVNDPADVEARLDDMRHYKVGEILRRIPKNPHKRVSGSEVANGSWFNLIRESMYKPCSTICQQNGKRSLSGNCHPLYDRKFTIAELKRITSVPDDFVCTGTLEEQWERLGRMVPPIMMMKISKEIEECVLKKLTE